MRKYIKALGHLCTTSSLLLTLATCRGSDGYREPLAPDGQPKSPAVTLSPATFHLQEGDSLPLEVKTGDLVVPTSQVRWSVEPSSAAQIIDGHVLHALAQTRDVRVTAKVGASTSVATGSISAVPADLEQVGSLVSTGVAGRALADSLTVQVLSDSGKKVEGVAVRFEVLSGGGSLSHTTRMSGPDGLARSAWTLGATPGPQVVRASVEGLEALTFSVEVLPDFASATVRAVQGAGQESVPGELLPTPLTLLVSDSLGNPLAGMEVTWEFSSGKGYEAGADAGQAASPLVLVTGPDGHSSVRWQVGTVSGPQTASAHLSSDAISGAGGPSKADDAPPSVTFDAAVVPGPADVLNLGPNAASLEVGDTVTFAVSPLDEFGNPISDLAVTWASSDPSVATIGSDGVLTARAAGSASVAATRGDLTESATVSVSGSVDSSGLAILSGDGQTAPVDTRLPQPLRVRVTTEGGEPVVGASVTWSVSVGGGSVSPASSTTDVAGIAETALTLGTQVGTHIVRAIVPTLGSVDFAAVAVAGPVAGVVIAPAPAYVQVKQTKRFTATPEDQFGNPVNGVGAMGWSSSARGVATVDGSGVATGVAAGTAYIRASVGSFADSAALTVTTTAPPSDPSNPSAVTDLKLVSVRGSTATLRWTQVDDGAGAPAKYALRYGSPTISWGSAYPTEVSVAGTSVGAAQQHTFEGLQPGTTYQFRLVSYRGSLNQDAVFGPTSNTASGTTSAGGGQSEGPSVSVTPATVSLSAVGTTRRLSAAATDASGAPMQSPGFTWRSLSPAIATVSSSGLVTAQAVGTARIVVTASCCGADTATVAVTSSAPPPPLAGLLFQDGFESGDQSHQENGVRWSGSGSNVNVVSTIAHSGAHSLEFVFRGKPSGGDAVAQQRFNLGRNLKEIWVEFYIYYPDGTEGLGARYRHRDDTGSNNNKFLRIWGDEYGASNEVGASTWPLAGGDSRVGFEYEKDEKPMGAYGSGGPDPFVHDGTRGRWMHVQFHARLGTGPNAMNGLMEFWVDGVNTKAIDRGTGGTGLDLFNSSGMNYLNQGYLLGWANSGFDKDTHIFIDDVRFYDTDPGW